MPQDVAVLLGCQEPRLLVAPPSVSLEAGLELIDLCASVGMELDEFQKLALVEICAEAWPGKWASKQTLVEVCRQNGKGVIIEALQLGDLFLFENELSTYSAHKFVTAEEQARRLFFWIENCDDLRKRCKRPMVANGRLGVETLDRRRVKFVAREKDNGRGLTGDRVILDEALILHQVVMGALVPSLRAVPNPQINVFSSAGFGAERSDSDVMWSIRRDALLAALRHLGLPVEEPEELTVRGVEGAPLLISHSASPQARDDLYNPVHLARANPSYGARIDPEYVLTVERTMMTEEQFAQECLGLWPLSRRLEDEAEGESLRELWRQCEAPTSSLGTQRAFGVDVSPDSQSAAIWVAGPSSMGGWHLEIVEHGPGVEWAAPRVAELCGRHRAKVGVDLAGPAGVLMPDIPAKWVEKVSGAVMAAACSDLVAGLRSKAVHQRVPSRFEGVVAAALSGAVKAPHGDGGFTWSRKSSAVDISPLVAGTAALRAAKSPQLRKPTKSY